MCKTYNGYTNYETWNVSLWIDNNQGDYDITQEHAQEFYDENPDSAIYDLSNWIKEYWNESNPLSNDASVYSDLLQAALDSVNWYEIAENWIEVVKEEMEE